MVDNNTIKRIVRQSVDNAFYNYFKKAKKETKHILLDRLFPEERRVTSTIAGLQTSLGTSFWEKLALQFATINGFEVLENDTLQRPKIEPAELTNLINQVKKEREDNGGSLAYLRSTLNELYPNANTGNEDFIAMQKGKGSDIILKKNGKVHIFDTKTVQVNAGNGNTYNETVILWIAYYQYKYRIGADNIYAKLVFPYNSSNENDDTGWWPEYSGRIKPLSKQEVYVGNEFWSFVTDNDNALDNMIQIFNEVSEDVEFIDLYSQVFSCSSYEELQTFSKKVKVKHIEWTKGIVFKDGQELNTRKVLLWTHSKDNGEVCEFKSRINALLTDNFECDVCGKIF